VYLLFLVLVFIIHGSLYPWHFDLARGGADPFPALLQSWPQQWDYNDIRDVVVNIVLYVPLGAAAFLAAIKKHSPGTAIAAALGLGLTLSTSLELTQVYVPGRVGSICDVLFNFGGTIVGTLLARRFRFRFERIIEATSRQWNPRYASPPALLLACWASYQLYPCVPQFSPGSIPFEVMFLIKSYRFDENPTYWAEVVTTTAEWFCVALAIAALAGRMRPVWIVAAIGFRLAARPLLLTRPFALDEFLGAALALLLWIALPDNLRGRAGLGILILAIVLRQFDTLDFSDLPYGFGPIGVVLRTSFDYGALAWLLYNLSWHRVRRLPSPPF
jgi:VanZ family protein